MRPFVVEKTIAAFLAAFVMSGMSIGAVLAQTMSSTNYSVQSDVVSIGGGNSTSAGYQANDILGEMATGESLVSASYSACSGFGCVGGAPYLTFSVREGLSSPGSAGAGVALGTITVAAVKTSDGTTVNSIFLAAEGNGIGGVAVTVRDENGGLKRTSSLDAITSATATLVAGTEGYGLCVFSDSEGSGSPTAFNRVAPYASTCTKTTGHSVGAVSTVPQQIMASSGALAAGVAEILVKAASSASTAAGNDYADTLTFIATATY